jgi:cytosine/uracil/thiamine/allantoin permease
MYFTLGVIAMIVGAVILNVQNNTLPRGFVSMSKWDYAGGFLFAAGLFTVLYSLLSLAWRYLP